MVLREHLPLSTILAKWIPPFLLGHPVMIDAYVCRKVRGGLPAEEEDFCEDSEDLCEETETVLERWCLDLGTGCAQRQFEAPGQRLVSSRFSSVMVFDGPLLKVLDGVSGKHIKEMSRSTFLDDGCHLLNRSSPESAVFHDPDSKVVHVLDTICCNAQQLGAFEQVWTWTVDPLANRLALLCKKIRNSSTYVCTFDLETGTRGLDLQAEDSSAIAYLQDGTVLALVCCSRGQYDPGRVAPVDEPFLRLIDIASGDEIARHSCLMWLSRSPSDAMCFPCVRNFASSRSGQTLAAFGHDDQNEIEMEFINLSYDMSLCTRQVPAGNHIHNFSEFDGYGCSSLAIVDAGEGHQVLAGTEGTVFSFCASSGNLLWRLPLHAGRACTIVTTIPWPPKPIARGHDTTAVLKIPRAQHPIESVLHVELPAVIHEDEAAAVTAVQHADFVQQLCNNAVQDVSADSGGAGFWYCKLNRIPKALRSELCEGKSLLPCRRALEAEGYHYKLPESGAFVFVHPDEYKATLDSVADMKLTPDVVLFTASCELMLEEALLGGGALDAHAWVKSRNRMIIEDDMDAQSAKATVGDEGPLPTMERTFIGFSLVRNEDYDSPRTESTTRAHCPKITNHRRSE